MLSSAAEWLECPSATSSSQGPSGPERAPRVVALETLPGLGTHALAAAGPLAYTARVDETIELDCFGEIRGPVEAVADALTAVARCEVRGSGFDGSVRVRVRADGIELDSEPVAGGHLLNGVVGGDAGVVALRTVSGKLAAAGIVHRFELYDVEHQLVLQLEHRWEATAYRGSPS